MFSYKVMLIISFAVGVALLTCLCFLVGAWRGRDEECKIRFGIQFVIWAVVFLLSLSEVVTYPVCSNCGEKVNSDYCTHCGAIVEENITPTCPECGEVCHTNFCGDCGTKMDLEEGE